MLVIRSVEDLVQALFLRGEVYGTTHLYSGQEAVAVGFASALGPADRVACTYRGHGHALALGLEPELLLAELLGRSTGVNGGRAGSMNVVDLDHGLIGCFGIVGGSIAAATGVALALRGSGRIAVAYFGDGTTNQAYFFECLNFAKVFSLPLVFVCENNGYGEYTPMAAVTAGEIISRATAMEIPARIVDGMDIQATRAAALEVVAQVRGGGGPVFVEARTYRFVGHSRSDPGRYRPEGELDRWRERDPLTLAQAWLREHLDDAERRIAEVDDSRRAGDGDDRGLGARRPVPGAGGGHGVQMSRAVPPSTAGAGEAEGAAPLVGAQLRERRFASGMSLRELARRLDVSPSLVSQIETARSSRRCARCTRSSRSWGSRSTRSSSSSGPPSRSGAPPAPAAAPAAPPRPATAGVVHRADDRRVIELESGVRWERMAAWEDLDVEFMVAVYGVGGSSSADGRLMRHSGREFGMVLSGTLSVTVGFDDHVLGPGDSITFQSTTPHRLRNDGAVEVRAIWITLGRYGGE